MQFRHGDFVFDLDEEWWVAAGMEGWRPLARSYRVAPDRFPNMQEVPLNEIAPVRRQLSNGVFNDDGETGLSARDRTINILRGFLDDVPLPPVEIVAEPAGAMYLYRLKHGAHRFYLSIASGFTHIPVIKGFVL
jgi:hypothetical protein